MCKDKVWACFKQQALCNRDEGDKAEMHNLHGYNEGGDFYCVWACLLQALHYQCHLGSEQMPNLPK
ncbi:hypothetical protein HHK36_015966 [Tetracentron sinense]|uniref:Uncharacterized protein n=1 Tax=Tetracentron sinense TaxID=13715 RepID=A0A834Z743_TETSI|nr:hypothetical protein HHK36_015966 [Tetracentron sinense]